MLPVLWLGGCAESMPSVKPLKRFSEMLRGYDSTLTNAEKQAAIAELQKDKQRQEEQIDQAEGAPKPN